MQFLFVLTLSTISRNVSSDAENLSNKHLRLRGDNIYFTIRTEFHLTTLLATLDVLFYQICTVPIYVYANEQYIICACIIIVIQCITDRITFKFTLLVFKSFNKMNQYLLCSHKCETVVQIY